MYWKAKKIDHNRNVYYAAAYPKYTREKSNHEAANYTERFVVVEVLVDDKRILRCFFACVPCHYASHAEKEAAKPEIEGFCIECTGDI